MMCKSIEVFGPLVLFCVAISPVAAQNFVGDPVGNVITVDVPVLLVSKPWRDFQRANAVDDEFREKVEETVQEARQFAEEYAANMAGYVNNCYEVKFNIIVRMAEWDTKETFKRRSYEHVVALDEGVRPRANGGSDPYEAALVRVNDFESLALTLISLCFADNAQIFNAGTIAEKVEEILKKRGVKLDKCLKVEIEFDVLGFGSWHPPAPAEILRGPFGDRLPLNWTRITSTSDVNLVGSDDGSLRGTAKTRIVQIAGRGGSVGSTTGQVTGKREGDRITLPWPPEVFPLDLVDGYYYGTRRGPQGGRFIIRVQQQQDAALGAATAVGNQALFALGVDHLNRTLPSESVGFGLFRATPMLLTTALFANDQGDAGPGCCGSATESSTIAELIKMLGSKDIFARRDAARELAGRGPEAAEAVPALIKALKDKHDDRVPRYAAEALGRVGVNSETAREALRAAIKTEDPLLRISAAAALARIDPDQDATLNTLLAVLQDKILSERYPSAMAAAIQSLGNLRQRGRPASKVLMDIVRNERKASMLRAEACLALWRIDEDATVTLPVLSDLLKATADKVDYTVLQTAARVIAEMGPAAKPILPALVTQLAKPPVARSQPAAPKVSDEVIAQLEKQLANTPSQLKATLEKTIKQLKQQRAAESKTGDKKQVATSVFPPGYVGFLDAGFDAIAKVDEEQAAMRLIKLHSAENVTIRHHAMESLLSIEPEHSVPQLLKTAASQDGQESSCAARTLIRLDKRVRSQLPLLLKSLGSSDDRVQVVAAQLVGTLGSEARSAVPELEQMLKSEKTEVQLAAADALGRIVGEHNQALELAVKTASGKEPGLRYQAIAVLGDLGRQSEIAVTTLIGRLKEGDPFARYAAATTLGEIGPFAKRAIPVLDLVKKDPLPQVRAAANGAILKLEGDEK